jgi:hypothetical protein
MRTRSVFAVLLLVAAPPLSTPLPAQLRADPGTVIDGRVAVRVYVALGDDTTPYHPVGDLPLRVYRLGGDSVSVRTDDAGALTVALSPGEYRLVSLGAYAWHGRRYSWSLPLTVRGGMAAVDLTAHNAVVTGGTPIVAQAPAGAGGPAPTASTSARAPKDGTLGVVLSLLITGGGQMYAGKPGKGVGLLLLGVGSVVVGAAASECDGYYDSYDGYYYDDCDVAPLAVGAGIALGTWIYSMASAPSDVREYNARYGLVASLRRARPYAARGVAETHLVGLAVPLGR